MGKRISVFVMSLLVAATPILTMAESVINVKIDTKAIDFPDAKPYVDENSRTLVPVRFISESLGGKVDWDKATKTVTITKGKIIKLVIGSKSVNVDSKKLDLDTSPVIKDGRTFVPLRFVSEAFGATVGWDGKTKTINIGTVKDSTTTATSSADNEQYKVYADMIRNIVNYEVGKNYDKVYEYLNPNDLKSEGLTKENIAAGKYPFIAEGFFSMLIGPNASKYTVKCKFEKKSDTEIRVVYGLFLNKMKNGSGYNVRTLRKVNDKWYIDLKSQIPTKNDSPEVDECI